ncbi:MAG TPA: hypothetical protein VKX28_01660 [Xanthobacteraceae bacterium]|nr:hypothetical protein [Xanthobacteraceae bacterium]
MSSLPAPNPLAAECLGPPPLNPGDDVAGYETLLARLVAEVGPRGLIEAANLRDVADAMWEGARLRRVKAKLMTTSADRGMSEVLDAIGVPADEARALAQGWAAGELAAVGKVDAMLDAAGLDIHHVMAKTLSLRLDQIERIDRMIAAAEARRAALVREIARYREPIRTAGAIAATPERECTEPPAPEGAAAAAAGAAA